MPEMTYEQTLERWQEVQAAVKRLQDEERTLREGLFNGTFKNPTEGVNKQELPDGRILKGTYKLYRNVDQKAVVNLPEDLRERVIKIKYDLQLSTYRKLSSEERKQVDGIITVKPGMPGLEIVEPKE